MLPVFLRLKWHAQSVCVFLGGHSVPFLRGETQLDLSAVRRTLRKGGHFIRVFTLKVTWHGAGNTKKSILVVFYKVFLQFEGAGGKNPHVLLVFLRGK